MKLWGNKDQQPALVSYEKRQVANFERKPRRKRQDVDMKMILDRAKDLGADKVIIMDDGNTTELKFLNNRNSPRGGSSELDVISKRLITPGEIIDITFKANMPMLTYTQEHDEDNIMLSELPKVDDANAEDLAMHRDIQTVKARSLPTKREQEKEAYYQDLIQRYEAERAESQEQSSKIKHVPASSSS